MKASETSVLSFIGGLDKTFTIPPYQRNYEWTIEQCNELFNDIENAYLKENPTSFSCGIKILENHPYKISYSNF